jgi:hypothetical protein
MWRMKRKSSAVLERPAPSTLGRADLRAEIDRLTEANRRRRSSELDRMILYRRHELGMRLLDEAGDEPDHPDPAGVELPASEELPEFTPEELTPELLRAAILRDGCALVRRLVPRDAAIEYAQKIDRLFDERAAAVDSYQTAGGQYEEFQPDPRCTPIDSRPWVRAGGGVLMGDAPSLAYELFELLAAAKLPSLVERYLGEPPMVTMEKTTLRKADPSVPGAWHQDGHFLGDVRALNLWLSLSRCGDESPGLDIVPRRLDELVAAGGEGTFLGYQVTDETAGEVAAPKRVVRPIFEPGDALLFDELFLHQTGSDPRMPKPRYAVESWFFGGSAFPEYAPIAV